MCNFIRSNGEKCKLAPTKTRCGKHPVTVAAAENNNDSNIVEIEMSPQVSTPVVAGVVHTPAPSVIKPVEVVVEGLSDVPEMGESELVRVIADATVYKKTQSSYLELNISDDDEYDSDEYDTDSNDFFNDYEPSEKIIPDDEIPGLEEFERKRQAELEVAKGEVKQATKSNEIATPTKDQLRLWAYLIVMSNYHEKCDEADAAKLVLDSQQIDVLRTFVDDETKKIRM